MRTRAITHSNSLTRFQQAQALASPIPRLLAGSGILDRAFVLGAQLRGVQLLAARLISAAAVLFHLPCSVAIKAATSETLWHGCEEQPHEVVNLLPPGEKLRLLPGGGFGNLVFGDIGRHPAAGRDQLPASVVVEFRRGFYQ